MVNCKAVKSTSPPELTSHRAGYIIKLSQNDVFGLCQLRHSVVLYVLLSFQAWQTFGQKANREAHSALKINK